MEVVEMAAVEKRSLSIHHSVHPSKYYIITMSETEVRYLGRHKMCKCAHVYVREREVWRRENYCIHLLYMVNFASLP